MIKNETMGRKAFNVFNYSFLILSAAFCLLPIMNILAVSLSSSAASSANLVRFWPIDFNLDSYKLVVENKAFLKSIVVSLERVILGVTLNMFFTVIVAYPLSKEPKAFKWRGVYVWFFMITILFNGGLIPSYLVVQYTGLMDKIWALVIPCALNVFNAVVLLNFFRGLPKELEEAAFMDGASHWTILWKIYLPLSTPALATLSLFCIVNHWNSWFDGMIYMNNPSNYPMASFLRTVLINADELIRRKLNSNSLSILVDRRTARSAQLFIAMVPLISIYPFLQKYFTQGLVLGSVKG